MLKHWLYLKYVLRHKWFVFLAGLRTGAPIWRLIIHDWSKFLPSEWFPYAEWFYGYKGRSWYNAPSHSEERASKKEAFDYAWLLHQHHNPHHWQYWILREDSGVTKFLEIPRSYIREMVADWVGAGRAITGKWGIEAWYFDTYNSRLLETNTSGYIEYLVLSITEDIEEGKLK